MGKCAESPGWLMRASNLPLTEVRTGRPRPCPWPARPGFRPGREEFLTAVCLCSASAGSVQHPGCGAPGPGWAQHPVPAQGNPGDRQVPEADGGGLFHPPVGGRYPVLDRLWDSILQRQVCVPRQCEARGSLAWFCPISYRVCVCWGGGEQSYKQRQSPGWVRSGVPRTPPCTALGNRSPACSETEHLPDATISRRQSAHRFEREADTKLLREEDFPVRALCSGALDPHK